MTAKLVFAFWTALGVVALALRCIAVYRSDDKHDDCDD